MCTADKLLQVRPPKRSMNSLRLACFAVVVIAGWRNVSGQGFANLHFESTTITTVHFPGGDRYTATVPGWAWNTFNSVNGDPNSVALDDIALDAPAVTLQDSMSPFFPAIEGSYSILLQGGTTAGGLAYGTNGASIFQTGQIPLSSQSLIYLGWAAVQVAFNGQILSPIAIGNGAGYTVWGVDVSTYAGQSGELRFTSPWHSTGILDGIRFSSTPIPEPSAVGIWSVCILFFVWTAKRLNKKSGANGGGRHLFADSDVLCSPPSLTSAFGKKMRRSLSIGITGGIAIIAASLFYVSRPLIDVTGDTPLWSGGYDAARQATIYPGPGTPLAHVNAGGRLRVLWTRHGKDYRAYLVIGPHWQKGWVLYGQYGLMPSAKMNTSVPNQSVQPAGGSRYAQSAFLSHWRLPPVADARRSA